MFSILDLETEMQGTILDRLEKQPRQIDEIGLTVWVKGFCWEQLAFTGDVRR
jgi:hypothetical protein